MTTVSLKLPDPLAPRLEESARNKSISKSALIRAALETYLRAEEIVPEGSALSRAVDLRGVFSGPEDLSVNRSDLKNFGRQVIPTLSPD